MSSIPVKRCILNTTLCDKVWLWCMAGLCFFQALLFHPIIADRHDITEMSFKLSLNTYTPYTSRLFYLLSLSVCSNGVTLLMVHCRLSLKMMLDQNKNMCVYGHMSKKSRVGRLVLIFFFFFFFTIGKTGNSCSRFRNPIFHFRNCELCSFSTFFALNFDKKPAVE